MNSQEPDTQLEWFDASTLAPARRRRWAIMEPLRLRADHAVLGMILALVVGSVVFAVGVERGKHVAVAEQWAPSPKAAPKTIATSVEPPAVPAPKMNPAVSPKGATVPLEGTGVTHETLQAPKSPKTSPHQASRKPPTALAADSKFAIQVVSYSQPQLAQRELQRLQQRGEQAFLLAAGGHMVLLIGPFASKDRAGAKLVDLKQQYRDCFVRTL